MKKEPLLRVAWFIRLLGKSPTIPLHCLYRRRYMPWGHINPQLDGSLNGWGQAFLTRAIPINPFRIKNPIKCFLKPAHTVAMQETRGWFNDRNRSIPVIQSRLAANSDFGVGSILGR